MKLTKSLSENPLLLRPPGRLGASVLGEKSAQRGSGHASADFSPAASAASLPGGPRSASGFRRGSKSAGSILRNSAAVLVLTLAMSAPVLAISNLKKVQVTDGSQVDLIFDQKVGQSQIRTEFFNDIIQISLTDVSVYPAKISAVSGTDLTKIFAYQYAPKLVRCRLTVKGKAEDYQNKVQVRPNGKILSIRLGEGTDQISRSAAHPSTVTPDRPMTQIQPSAQAKADAKHDPAPVQKLDDTERQLLDRVLKGNPAKSAVAVQPAHEKREEKDKEKEKEREKDKDSEPLRLGGDAHRPLATGKPLPSPLRSFGMLAVVIGIFGACAFFAKKLKGTHDLQKNKGFSQFIGSVTKGLGRKDKMIEVVATHYLGPKKNIAVVRVAGRLLVLGVSNESINLITQLKDVSTENTAADENGASAGLMDSLAEEAIADSLVSSFAKPTSAAKTKQAQQAQLDEMLDFGDLALDDLMGSTVPEARGAGAVSAGSPMFADLLNAEQRKPVARAPIKASPASPQQPTKPAKGGIRAQIRTRIEGMKQL